MSEGMTALPRDLYDEMMNEEKQPTPTTPPFEPDADKLGDAHNQAYSQMPSPWYNLDEVSRFYHRRVAQAVITEYQRQHDAWMKEQGKIAVDREDLVWLLSHVIQVDAERGAYDRGQWREWFRKNWPQYQRLDEAIGR